MNILLIEDDDDVGTVIVSALKESGHSVEHAANGRDGVFMAASSKFDVIVLDRKLPGGIDGIRILETLRNQGDHTPVLILSGLYDVQDKLDGIKAGASDYLTKPFAMAELLARIDVLTRPRKESASATWLVVGDLEMNLLTRVVKRAGHKIDLSAQEFKLLEFFMRNPGRVLTRSRILESVWDYRFDPGTNMIEVQVSRLRRRIEEHSKSPILHTIRNVGYVLRPHNHDAKESKPTALSMKSPETRSSI